MFKNTSLSFIAFLQATALVIYILGVTSLMQFIGDNVPEEDTALTSLTILLMFVTSAVISAGIVLGRAGQLYIQKKQPEAYKLVGLTVVWMLAYFILFVAVILNT
jgi:hypothetical protein